MEKERTATTARATVETNQPSHSQTNVVKFTSRKTKASDSQTNVVRFTSRKTKASDSQTNVVRFTSRKTKASDSQTNVVRFTSRKTKASDSQTNVVRFTSRKTKASVMAKRKRLKKTSYSKAFPLLLGAECRILQKRTGKVERVSTTPEGKIRLKTQLGYII
ncbi:hypothetical protein ACOMHN_045642 [Nucella lapillus]